MEGIQLLDMVLNASPVVQAVMLMLLIMSIAVWAIAFAKGWQLRTLRKRTEQFQQDFGQTSGLRLYYDLEGKAYGDSPAAEILRAGADEMLKLYHMNITQSQALMEGAERAIHAQMLTSQQVLEKYLPPLATVGSSAPYIGLFGTVWGVMHAFAGLSHVKQATLSAVAPGIAEALIATALGLFAAIPAVWAYNRLTTRANRLQQTWEAIAEEVLVRLHRQARRLEVGEGVEK